MLKKYNLFVFVFCAYLITWGLILPIVWGDLSDRWHFIGAIGPAIAALIAASVTGDLERFVQLLFRLPTRQSWWVLVLPFLLGLLGFIIAQFVGSDVIFDVSDFQVMVLPMLLYGLLEEVGWRGYALPRLQQKYGALSATFVLTLIWGVWHIPMFFYRFDFDSVLMVIGFFVSLYFGAVLLTALYNYSNRSILAVMIFHICNNLVSIGKGPIFMSIYSMLLMLVAIGILKWTKGALFYKTVK